MNRYPASLANHLSAYGRYGDDQLVHMNSQEVAALDGIAAAFGRELTRNPHTGMKEAFNLFDILPIALNFIPGIGTAASIALSAASGAASAAVEGGNPLEGALMGGLTGAVGASLGGGADAAKEAAKGAEIASKGTADAISTAGLNVSPELAAEGVTAADIAGMAGNTGPQLATGATGAPTNILAGPTQAPGMFQDIFGPGTDASTKEALQSIWKKENLPYTMMGAAALSSLPPLFGGDEGPGRPEYKDIPENFPGRPRMVNPDYDPTMSAFGEQNAFSSGVDYLGRGYAEGGEVKKGGGGFNIEGMLGGVIPMIIDGFTDGNKYGSGILGMLFNERKPWEYGRDKGGPQPMNPGPSSAIPAPGSSMPSPISGFAYGGPVRGYKGGGPVFESPEYLSAPEGMMWETSVEPGGRNMGKRGRDRIMPRLVQNPNYRPRERNIRPTNMAGLYSGNSPFVSPGYTQVPLPGGQMGAPPAEMAASQPANPSSFEIATSPTGGMPTSGGGMGGQGYQGGAQQGGKSGGRSEGGGKRGNIGEYILTDPKLRDAPQINPGNQGATPEYNIDQRLSQLASDRASANNLRNIMSGTAMTPGGETVAPSPAPGGEATAPSPAPNLGIMASMPGAATAAPGQAGAQPEQPSTLPPMGAGVGMGMAYGGRVRGYANGGMVDQAMQTDDRTIVKAAIAAIMGQSPDPKGAIAMFVDRFGEEALQMLVQKVQGGMQGGMQDGRYMQGPGDGLSDSIPAVVDGKQPSALSSGEFVIPADAVSHLGNGDNKTGAKELYGMIDRLRQARTGNTSAPPAINQRGIMPA